ncbi:DUF6882 domain-containing protein [Corynebacterium minutissimum]|uniref:Uncharacterized protein n=1 Tax=Corynebacterium minutissimum TaxID=38301 RepID=A0A376CWN7_9CORY|nr:DUF6882 domain-containing protein [Corynebacterium minutissimum]QRP60536.1 hypothetical protein I6J26_10290 [Corynebacterium minutissimum]STC76219.1 Uncharacterised protein [Corynebacterium minutissimum]
MDSARNLYSAGAFIQAGIDATFAQRLGPITDVEVNFTPTEPDQPEHDQRATVRFTTSSGVHDFDGLRLASMQDGQFHWATGLAQQADLPEFHGPQPDTALLRGLARRLVGDRPVVRVPQGDAEALVAVDFTEIDPTPSSAILAGLEKSGDIEGGVDERIATTELASYMNVPHNNPEALAQFEGSRIVALPQLNGQVGLRARDILADAHFLATEHNFFLDARFPNLRAELDPGTSRTVVTAARGSLTVPAHLVATLDESAGTFTWAWADELASTMAAQAASNLRRFAYDRAVPELLRAQVPIADARQARLPQLAMPILGLWTLLPVHLPDGRLGLALSDAPAFRLPAPSPAATQATLNVAVPPGVDEQRARAAYQRQRGF